MYQAVLQFETQTFFFLVHLVDADVLLVLSCYTLISVGSGFFERQKICKTVRPSSTLHGNARS